MIEDENYKGITGLQNLLSSIKFSVKKPASVADETITATDFVFADDSSETFTANADSISFALSVIVDAVPPVIENFKIDSDKVINQDISGSFTSYLSFENSSIASCDYN